MDEDEELGAGSVADSNDGADDALQCLLPLSLLKACQLADQQWPKPMSSTAVRIEERLLEQQHSDDGIRDGGVFLHPDFRTVFSSK